MKRFALPSMAILIGMAFALTSTSCIFDAPGDRFYRTMWESEQVHLSPHQVEDITLEFLCENYISLKTGSSRITSYGTYCCNQQTALFQDLTLELDEQTITFIDALLEGDNLILRWRAEDSDDTFTTSMHRLSLYE